MTHPFHSPLLFVSFLQNAIGEVQEVLYNAERDCLSLKHHLNTASAYYHDDGRSVSQFTYSSKTVRQPTNYCVATIRNNGCFINPIQSIYQMRPDFTHCDPKLSDLSLDQPNADSTTTSLDPFSSNSQQLTHCQIDRSLNNDDLFWNRSTGHPTE